MCACCLVLDIGHAFFILQPWFFCSSRAQLQVCLPACLPAAGWRCCATAAVDMFVHCCCRYRYPTPVFPQVFIFFSAARTKQKQQRRGTPVVVELLATLSIFITVNPTYQSEPSAVCCLAHCCVIFCATSCWRLLGFKGINIATRGYVVYVCISKNFLTENVVHLPY